MMMYAQYLVDRYLGKKGQGLTEYAIVLLLVVLVGAVIWGTSGIKESLDTMYTNINTTLSSIAKNQ